MIINVPISIIILTYLGPSSAPLDVELRVNDGTVMSVTWNMVPDIHQNGIILYEVSYQPMEIYDSTVLLQNTSELSISLTGLHEYANYRVQVRAYTRTGPGDYSTEKFARTREAGIHNELSIV